MKQPIEDDTQPSARGRWQVLIVDDVQDLRDSFREMLELEGFQVVEAADGRAALQILRASRYPMVVLLDLMMPLMRGDTVIESLAKEHRLPGKHAIIVITAQPATTLPRSLRDTLKKYAIPIVSKTVSLDEIVEQVDQAEERISMQQRQPW